MDLDQFKHELNNLDSENLLDYCRKHLIHGTPFVFNGREHEYYEFRKKIASQFNIYFNEIYISGSAKLGFSPLKETEFSYESDIDVSIVSPALFNEIMEKIRVFQMEIRNNRRSVTKDEIDSYHKFLEYTAIGWIRPDLLPRAFEITDLKNRWFTFFTSISHGRSEVGNYKVSAGVFFSYKHLEEYTLEGLVKVKNKMKVEQ